MSLDIDFEDFFSGCNNVLVRNDFEALRFKARNATCCPLCDVTLLLKYSLEHFQSFLTDIVYLLFQFF